MAKFKPILGDLRGKIGGNVFSANAFGAYVRQKVTPVNPQSSYQQQIREWLTEGAQHYSNVLPAGAKNAWKDWAGQIPKQDVFGNAYVMTPLQAFLMVNLNKRIVTTPPFTYEEYPPVLMEVPVSLETITPTGKESDQSVQVAFTPTPTSGEVVHLIYVSSRMRPNQIYASNFKKVDYIGASSASPCIISPRFIDRFGTIAEGERFLVRVKPLNLITYLTGSTIEAELNISA